MSFEKKKAIEKIDEELKRDEFVKPKISEWASPSLLLPDKDWTYRFMVDYRCLHKQREKTCWSLPRVYEVIDSLDGNINLFFSNIEFFRDNFRCRTRTRIKFDIFFKHFWAFVIAKNFPWQFCLSQELFRTSRNYCLGSRDGFSLSRCCYHFQKKFRLTSETARTGCPMKRSD